MVKHVAKMRLLRRWYDRFASILRKELIKLIIPLRIVPNKTWNVNYSKKTTIKPAE